MTNQKSQSVLHQELRHIHLLRSFTLQYSFCWQYLSELFPHWTSRAASLHFISYCNGQVWEEDCDCLGAHMCCVDISHTQIIWVRTTLWVFGKFAISCSFMSIYVYASEIFPTNIRNLSIGFCEMMSRVGGILAPYVKAL
ncbi:unnamed protein product, partial [Cylicostephanus goldi]